MRFAAAALLICACAVPAASQTADSADETAVDLIAGVVVGHRPVPETELRGQCLDLPGSGDEIVGPHGDRLLSASCRVASYEPLDVPGWSSARYARHAIFTAEDPSRGADARDTIEFEEIVLFERAAAGSLVPVWHMRYESDEHAVWRSMTLAVSRPRPDAVLVSVMSCVNGTGGCTQDFLLRAGAGRFTRVRPQWLHELPPGFAGRIRHGFHIDPRTLKGEAALYRDGDPNCCPAESLEFELQLRADALVLRQRPRVTKSKP